MDNEKKHIFLVDDDPTVIMAGKGILSEIYKVTTASSAEEMMELLGTNKPHLILLDINMPTMSGYEAIEKLKEDDSTKDIPIIFLTGNTDVQAKLKGYSLGAVDYITKPFNPDTLLSRIRLSLM